MTEGENQLVNHDRGTQEMNSAVKNIINKK